ncbi:MAG: A/G-specific adenine glycosylase [bacterium]|nr:A/G-specific adenine glycosylase [bacterium]
MREPVPPNLENSVSEEPLESPCIDDPAYLRRRLLAWFRREARDLPWRRRRTLYGTWIAEVMLQQTTVAAVVPFWERFLDRFPDVATLAAAEEAEVLALWSGLGYYRRARSLLAAARRIVADHGGRLPADRAGWAALPGVGAYASGAIASMALGQTEPAVDANVRRVVTRWAAASSAAADHFRGRRLDDLAASLVPQRSPGPWNEAVMELGALVCTARTPACAACPVRDGCRAGRSGRAAEVPPPQTRPAPTAVRAGAFVAVCGRQVLLVPPGKAVATAVARTGAPLREDLDGLHRGLWGVPSTPWYPSDRPGFEAGAGQAWLAWLAGRGVEVVRTTDAGSVSHAITRWRLRVTVHVAEIPQTAATALARASGGRWSDPAGELPLSRLASKILARGAGIRAGG